MPHRTSTVYGRYLIQPDAFDWSVDTTKLQIPIRSTGGSLTTYVLMAPSWLVSESASVTEAGRPPILRILEPLLERKDIRLKLDPELHALRRLPCAP